MKQRLGLSQGRRHELSPRALAIGAESKDEQGGLGVRIHHGGFRGGIRSSKSIGSVDYDRRTLNRSLAET